MDHGAKSSEPKISIATIDCRIRPFRMPDYAQVRALWENAGPGLSLRPSDEESEIEKKLTRDPDIFLVAEVGEKIIGVVIGAWDGRRGWIHHLTVCPEFRGKGIAKALVRTIEERLKAKGCLKVNLLVHSSNTVARKLYQSLGYSEMHGIIAMGKEL